MRCFTAAAAGRILHSAQREGGSCVLSGDGSAVTAAAAVAAAVVVWRWY